MSRQRRNQKGSIPLLFLISFSVIIITFIMLSATQGGVMISRKSWAQFYGQRLADSVIYAAVGELKEDKIAFEDDLQFVVEEGKVFGELTFVVGDEPYSTNNLVGNTKKTGWNGAAVPPGFCHLVAVGHYHGLEVVREALVKDPPYPYSLASAGQIDAESVEVFGLPAGEYGSLDATTNPILSYDEADKEPSHIVSNSTAGGADKAVTLGTDTKIAGDVKASGEIELDAGAVVQGLVLPGSTEQNLPNVTIEGFDPAGEPDKYDWNPNPPPGPDPPVLVGRARYEGNLTIGDLDMAEGLLYVKGDVTITGKVKGKGAIVATGKITVTGSMETEADHAALVAKGDIKIHGDGPNSSRFQGLIYSEGSIDIAKTQIIGAAVSKKSTGTTKLEDVKMISVPELTKMNFDLHVTLEEAKKSGSTAYSGDGDPIGILHNGVFTQLAPNPDTEALKALADLLGETDPPGPSQTWQFGSMGPSGFDSSADGKSKYFLDSRGSWRDYVLEHKNKIVQVDELFDIDLNTLVSLDVQLEMMYHTTVPYRD